MTLYRDVVLKREERENKKQDKLPFRRAVLVTATGSQTATADPISEVWAVEDERRVWYQVDGSTQPAQILCRRIPMPYVGLGVIIGYADGSNEQEVLADDFFLTHSGSPSGWASTGPDDLQPGGNHMLWVQTKVITPLTVYPSAATGLMVNVFAGDYPYLGTRKTFAGQNGFSLAAPGTPGEHRYSGLYLDSANALQVVYGTAISTASTPAEPTWPAGAFRLAVVLIANGQTAIDFNEDIFDRRMAWSDEQGGAAGGGWPNAGKAMINSTEYATIDLAHTAASAGDIIKLGQGTFDLGSSAQTISKAVAIVALDPVNTIITSSVSGSPTLNITIAGVTLRNVTIRHTGAGSVAGCIATDDNNTVIENCIIEKTSGAASTAYGVWFFGGSGQRLVNCRITVTSGTVRYALLNDTVAATIALEGGQIDGRVSILGTLNWMPEAKIQTNLLADSLSTIWTWQEGSTFNDKADDSYIGLWNCLNNGQTPDITRSTGGSSDPFDYYMTITFDSAASQAGIVQFLKASDTRKYRGQVVSLSFDAWGTNAAEVRAAVLSWGSTADTLTSDVVGTWATDNPTLATNWSYANTPAADIGITSTRDRYVVNNITIPATANNIAVFIWTSAEEASTDVLNLARVRLEPGPVATTPMVVDETVEKVRIFEFYRRYTSTSANESSGANGMVNSVNFIGGRALDPPMRVAPTLVTTGTASDYSVYDGTDHTPTDLGQWTTRADFLGIAWGASGLTAGNASIILFKTTSAFLGMDARL